MFTGSPRIRKNMKTQKNVKKQTAEGQLFFLTQDPPGKIILGKAKYWECSDKLVDFVYSLSYDPDKKYIRGKKNPSINEKQ